MKKSTNPAEIRNSKNILEDPTNLCLLQRQERGSNDHIAQYNDPLWNNVMSEEDEIFCKFHTILIGLFYHYLIYSEYVLDHPIVIIRRGKEEDRADLHA